MDYEGTEEIEEGKRSEWSGVALDMLFVGMVVGWRGPYSVEPMCPWCTGASGSPHIRPTYELDMKVAGQPMHLG